MFKYLELKWLPGLSYLESIEHYFSLLALFAYILCHDDFQDLSINLIYYYITYVVNHATWPGYIKPPVY